jgi:hypothetical protein
MRYVWVRVSHCALSKELLSNFFQTPAQVNRQQRFYCRGRAAAVFCKVCLLLLIGLSGYRRCPAKAST